MGVSDERQLPIQRRSKDRAERLRRIPLPYRGKVSKLPADYEDVAAINDPGWDEVEEGGKKSRDD